MTDAELALSDPAIARLHQVEPLPYDIRVELGRRIRRAGPDRVIPRELTAGEGTRLLATLRGSRPERLAALVPADEEDLLDLVDLCELIGARESAVALRRIAEGGGEAVS